MQALRVLEHAWLPFNSLHCLNLLHTQFSPDLRDLTKSLLSKNPKNRPSADALLKLPWLKVR